MRRSLLLGLTALLGAGGGATAWTATLTVSLTVNAACLVDANDLIFGTVNPLSGSPTDGAAALSVTCTNTTPYQVALNAGTGGGATVASRKMKGQLHPTAVLAYSLYRDSTRTQIWGQTAPTDTKSGTGTGLPQSLTVYGRVFAGQNTVQVDSYRDTVQVTVTY